jgi:hypothetical protein
VEAPPKILEVDRGPCGAILRTSRGNFNFAASYESGEGCLTPDQETLDLMLKAVVVRLGGKPRLQLRKRPQADRV